MMNEYASVLLNLTLVILLMVAILLLVRKFKLTKFGKGKFVNIIQVLPIGQKEKIVLLEINNSYILLGATANRIETLHIYENFQSSQNDTANNHEKFSVALGRLHQAQP